MPMWSTRWMSMAMRSLPCKVEAGCASCHGARYDGPRYFLEEGIMALLARILATLALALATSYAGAQGQPIRIGSTLALTGGLAATAAVHKIVGEIYVEDLNRRGGLLGRKVEWIVKDDQS